jgi:hypothetical protein
MRRPPTCAPGVPPMNDSVITEQCGHCGYVMRDLTLQYAIRQCGCPIHAGKAVPLPFLGCPQCGQSINDGPAVRFAFGTEDRLN